MTRRQVLVQLDDQLVDDLDALAKKLNTNRSELLRRGARSILDADELAQADRQLAEAYRRTPPDPALTDWATRVAAETGPAW